MNPIYFIMESAHRWLILAGLCFLAGILGTIFMFAYVWPHPLALVWLLACLLATAGFLVAASYDWMQVNGILAPEDAPAMDTGEQADVVASDPAD